MQGLTSSRTCHDAQTSKTLAKQLREQKFQLHSPNPRMLPREFNPERLDVDCSAKTPEKPEPPPSGRARSGRGGALQMTTSAPGQNLVTRCPRAAEAACMRWSSETQPQAACISSCMPRHAQSQAWLLLLTRLPCHRLAGHEGQGQRQGLQGGQRRGRALRHLGPAKWLSLLIEGCDGVCCRLAGHAGQGQRQGPQGGQRRGRALRHLSSRRCQRAGRSPAGSCRAGAQRSPGLPPAEGDRSQAPGARPRVR